VCIGRAAQEPRGLRLDGVLVYSREVPWPAQEIAFTKGSIPYISADRGRLGGCRPEGSLALPLGLPQPTEA